MQASSASSNRAFAQRRSPAADLGPPPNVRPSSPGSSMTMQPRPSASSLRSTQPAGSRRQPRDALANASLPLSQIEKSVTHLLVATKQLLETLTQWSRGQATDTQVSDVYVRLGYEFNMACRAFTAINVDISDLGNVPDSLRHILEATLSQEASSESLEKYLPRIRDIIINLLHGLKRKQQRLRHRQQGRDRDAPPGIERAASVSTVSSANSGLTNMLDEGIDSNARFDFHRGDSSHSQQAHIHSSPSRRLNAKNDQPRASAISDQPSLSSNPMQSIPVVSAAAPGEDLALNSGVPHPGSDISIDAFPPPPPPPSDQQSSALAALQKGGDLERRASRRYSQYQISKHLVGVANGVPILPSQNTPVPNRTRKEARESLRAVQTRESSSRQPTTGHDSSPVRVPSRVTEESGTRSPVTPVGTTGSPVYRSPNRQGPGGSVRGPLQGGVTAVVPPADAGRVEPGRKKKNKDATNADESHAALAHSSEPKAGEPYFQVSPPLTPTKDLTLFLQYKSKVKKIVLPEGRDELSIGRLQLAFIEKFSWNTQQNGADLPEIYIQDPVSGVRHELEELSDVKDRTVLVLNVEPLEEVKRHIDDGLSALGKLVCEVRQHVDDQGNALQRVSDRQQETASELVRLMGAPAPTTPAAPSVGGSKTTPGSGRKASAGHVGELQNLRRDLAVLRQTYSSFQSEMQSSMSAIRTKAANVKTAVVKAAVPTIEGDAGYSYVTTGRKKLNSDSDRLVGKVDDLQDMVEDLRKDVVHRGVRPLPRQLETAAKDIGALSRELKRMEEYIKQEKPIWTKIWEKELEDVCQGRDELRVMEDLLVDLRDDLEKATETFTLVEQATKEQMKDNGSGSGPGSGSGTPRQFSRGLNSLGNSVDQNAAKEDMLGELRALQPNHEDRLEAIERAEKLRQKELESRRGNALQREISNFVEEGKLKKSGGFEEVERARKAKDERIRREVWERQNGMIPADPVGEEEEHWHSTDEGPGAAETEGGEGGKKGKPDESDEGPDDAESDDKTSPSAASTSAAASTAGEAVSKAECEAS